MFQPTMTFVLCLVVAACLIGGNNASAQSLSQQLKSEPIEQLAQAAREQGSAVRGAITLTSQQMQCTRCHAAASGNPIGPDLLQLDKQTSDAYLIDSLLSPSKEIKKGYESVVIATTNGQVLSGRIVSETPAQIILQTSSENLERVTIDRAEIEEQRLSNVSSMPDNLVDQLSDRKQFLDLVRYLMQLVETSGSNPVTATPSGGKQIAADLRGIILLKDFNCQGCHQDDVTQTLLHAKVPPNLSISAKRIQPDYMQKFIAHPLSTKPGTTMPDMMAGFSEQERQQAARELTHYLIAIRQPASLSAVTNDGTSTQPSSPARTTTGDGTDEAPLNVDQELDDDFAGADAKTRGERLFHSVGCVACHSPRNAQRQELSSALSVPLGSVERKYHREGLTAFLENPLASRPSGRMPQLGLSHWEAVDIATYLTTDSESQAAEDSFEIDNALAAKGKARFAQLGCVQCHPIDGTQHAPTSLALSQARSDRGCLSTQAGNWPQFTMSDQQRAEIRAALARDSQQLTDAQQLNIQLTAFRCVNCHQRDDLGGVTPEREHYFQTTNENLGPQGRIPPTLTGVGAKLEPQWLRQVLVSGRRIRPYVLTRMPQYGTNNVTPLVDMFQQLDELPATQSPAVQEEKELKKIGAELVGTAGLNCIVCHTFRLEKAANMPAVDLTEMAERLQKDWYNLYMRDPQHLSPNTIMPSFWPAGQAMRKDILDGNTDLQIEAIWQYLLDGRQANTPRGLIVEPIELLAKSDEAVMLRRSYPDVGKRGIGVGYPQQVNILFDAEQLRLAMIWHGKFADPAGVWRSQGHGRVRPLGEKLIKFAAGPDLERLNDRWIVDDSRPPQHRFRGYSLDTQQRPKLRYTFETVNVEDYLTDPIDLKSSQPFLQRTITLSSDKNESDLSFRIASGKSIQKQPDGSFLIDQQLRVSLDAEHRADVISASGMQELRIPITINNSTDTLRVDYRW